MKTLTKRQLQKRATALKHKEERKIKRDSRRLKREQRQIWREAIIKRDNNKCQLCRKDLSSCNPIARQVHHLLDKRNFKELITNIDNGILLCYRCHRVGKYSAHMNAVFFSNWLKKNKPHQYNFVMSYLKLVVHDGNLSEQHK